VGAGGKNQLTTVYVKGGPWLTHGLSRSSTCHHYREGGFSDFGHSRESDISCKNEAMSDSRQHQSYSAIYPARKKDNISRASMAIYSMRLMAKSHNVDW